MRYVPTRSLNVGSNNGPSSAQTGVGPQLPPMGGGDMSRFLALASGDLKKALGGDEIEKMLGAMKGIGAAGGMDGMGSLMDSLSGAGATQDLISDDMGAEGLGEMAGEGMGFGKIGLAKLLMAAFGVPIG